MKITIELGPEFQKAKAALDADSRAIVEGASAGLKEGSQLAAARVNRERLSGQSLKRRTGTLGRDVTGWLESEFEAVVGVNSPAPSDAYNWLLGDETKTIRPVKGRFLTIPVGENLTPSGVPRWTSPRQVPDGFFVRTGGRLLFGYKKGTTGRGRFRPLFTLVTEVTIEGSDALAKGVADSVDDFSAAIQQAIERRLTA